MAPTLAELLLQFLEKDCQKAIDLNVVGDVMFDEYHEVEVERISPEFPIPVYKSNSIDPCSGIIPGGAANVAYQFKHFNVNCELVALLNKLGEVSFNAKGINTGNCKVLNNIWIPTKKRFYCQGVPLVRHDIEKENYGVDEIKKYLFDLQVPDADFTIFSDYSKGLFSNPWFRKFITKTKSIVDPKNSFIDMWEGCSFFKPNASEAEKLSERKNIHDQLEFFIDSLKCEGVVITRSGLGVMGKDNKGDTFEVVPDGRLPNPASVIGAGDCFISFLTMALARGFPLEQAAQIAFAAGCCYVRKSHNSPLSPSELLTYCGVKIVSNVEILKNRNFKLVATNGCFDAGCTLAHVECLKFAKSQGDKLLVAINSDSSVTKLKGKGRPILPAEERAKIISALEFVDFVAVFNEDTPYEIYKKLMPDIIVKGGDYKKNEVVGNDLADVVLFPLINCVSTTDKVKKLSD